MYYYLSIGTNISPEKNAAKIVYVLAQHFEQLVLFPFIYTHPDNIKSNQLFLNALAVIKSTAEPQVLKQQLNSIEERLGRDRSDPHRSTKDRPADIDILGFADNYDEQFFRDYKEPYIRRVFESDSLNADLSEYGLPTTQGPTTIYFERSTGHIRVVDKPANGLIDGHIAALVSE